MKNLNEIIGQDPNKIKVLHISLEKYTMWYPLKVLDLNRRDLDRMDLLRLKLSGLASFLSTNKAYFTPNLTSAQKTLFVCIHSFLRKASVKF